MYELDLNLIMLQRGECGEHSIANWKKYTKIGANGKANSGLTGCNTYLNNVLEFLTR